MSGDSYKSCFERIFDVAVIGGGHVGFWAACELERQGKNVLLIEPRGDLIWESGRAMEGRIGKLDDPLWLDFLSDVAKRTATSDRWLDPAIAEVVATDRLRKSRITPLYYASPVDVELVNDKLCHLIVATKSGLKRVTAKQWIDATESGSLLCMMQPALKPRAAASRTIRFFLQRADWSNDTPLQSTIWDCERYGEASLNENQTPRDVLVDVLSALSESDQQAVMSHCSVETIARYDESPAVCGDLVNVCCASPALVDKRISLLTDRVSIGLAAASRIEKLPVNEPDIAKFDQSIERPVAIKQIKAQVVIAGAGTGGALAAIAAGRNAAQVVCIEPMAFAGGIGAGGGIHSYYFGVMGGLQKELDKRVKSLMGACGKTLSGGPFNPDAKKIAIEQMMKEAGVDLQFGMTIYDVETVDSRITRAFAACQDGPVEIVADAWVDATGDGDLCHAAGAPSLLGREGDGLPHAYSQSGGTLYERHDGIAMQMINMDAGWCDPTDSEELTRARIVAINQYAQDQYNQIWRPTYIAPAIGLRQSRQIQTDYVLQLDDLIVNRRFEDLIGFTGCHYDNHAVDYQFESAEAIFWVWVNRRWREPIGSDLSYRMLLPVGVDNLWVACRALGVSRDAHHCVRMQRDMQRVGEAAGFAAAVAVRNGGPVDSRRIDMTALHDLLQQAGSLRHPKEGEEPIFNSTFIPMDEKLDVAELSEELIALDNADRGRSIWTLYRHKKSVQDEVIQRLASENKEVSWLAATLCAMWGDSIAEDRLIQAVQSREYGYDDESEAANHARPNLAESPKRNVRLVQNWVTAVALLRLCGTSKAVEALVELAKDESLSVDMRSTIASTLHSLAERGAVHEPQAVAKALDVMSNNPQPDAVSIPQRAFAQILEATARRDESEKIRPLVLGEPTDWLQATRCNSAEDHTWQLHLAIARVRQSLGLPQDEHVQRFLNDERRVVRRAFEAAVALSEAVGV